MDLSERDGRRHWPVWALIAMVLLALAAASPARAASSHGKGNAVKVMTRNLYFGANLRPALDITSLQGFVDFAGKAFHQEVKNDFRIRSKGLATEILNKKPDLVGLQEAAVYRDAPCSDVPIPPSATHVRRNGDHLKLLMNRLNAKGKHYRVVVKQPEFDFQIWANTDGNASTGSPFGCETEIRLTYGDVILARVHAGVKTTDAKRGHFDTLLEVQPAGVAIDVARGWVSVDAKVRDSHRFRFVNTHLEAYDDTASNHTNQGTDVGKGRIREAQARELFAPGGPAAGRLPVVLAGDLNSDDKTLGDGDRLAYLALKHAGFRERGIRTPTDMDAPLLRVGAPGCCPDFDEQDDHVMTNSPKGIKLLSSSATGRHPVDGYWDSDHLGVFSKLRIRR